MPLHCAVVYDVPCALWAPLDMAYMCVLSDSGVINVHIDSTYAYSYQYVAFLTWMSTNFLNYILQSSFTGLFIKSICDCFTVGIVKLCYP